MKVLIISGSLNSSSYTVRLCNEISRSLQDDFNTTFLLWDIKSSPLPFYTPEYSKLLQENLPQSVQLFLEAIQNADAIIFASPLYHNSFSGVLKNAIDFLSIKIMRHKAVGLISHGSSVSVQALDHLRIIMRSLNCVAIPTQICTTKQDFIDIDGNPKISENIKTRINRFNAELLNYAGVFHGYNQKYGNS